MNKIIVVLILFFPFVLSCKDNDTTNRFRVLDESLRRSNNILVKENARLYNEVIDKMHYPVTAAKAQLWQPKMEEVNTLTSSIIAYIDSLRIIVQTKSYTDAEKRTTQNNEKDIVDFLFEKQHKSSELFTRLTRYRKSIIDTIKPEEFSDNPYFSKSLLVKKNEFEKSFVNYTGSDSQNIIVLYFEHTASPEATTMLDKIQNDILFDAYTMLDYFASQITFYRDYYFNTFSAIVTKNTNYLKPGELLEVYAGVGSFSDAMKPTFIINGIKVPVIDGRTTYQLIVKGKPGKHNIPVVINYTQPDGRERTVTEKVEYTVIK